MNTRNKTILVAGATGQQGGAVAARLLADGWRVRALTRNPNSAAARALADAGAEPVAGDLDDRFSLDAVVKGAYGVFSVHSGGYDGSEYAHDTRHEVRSGVNLAAAAEAAGVAHLVYSSSVGVDNDDLMPLMPILQFKAEVEADLKERDLAWTILRPVSFMDNYVGSQRGLRDGALATALAADTTEPLIAVDDIAALTALAFADPVGYSSLTLELAGDNLTQRQIAEALSRAAGRPVPYQQIPVDTIREFSEDTARALEAMNRIDLRVDIDAIRGHHPGLLSFDAWLAGPGSAKLANYFKQLDSAV